MTDVPVSPLWVPAEACLNGVQLDDRMNFPKPDHAAWFALDLNTATSVVLAKSGFAVSTVQKQIAGDLDFWRSGEDVFGETVSAVVQE